MKTKENGAVMKNGMWIFLLMMVYGGPKQYAFAQSDIGGGGDIYECVEGGKKKFYLMDVLAAMRENNLPVRLKIPNDTLKNFPEVKAREVELKSAIMQARLSRFDPVRASKLGFEVRAIWQDIQALLKGERAPNQLVALSESKLIFDDDSGSQVEFTDCIRSRMVTQREPLGPKNDMYYKFNRNLMTMLDTDNLVATLWHEAIYRMMREEAQHKTSEYAQYLNRELFTASFESWNSCEYARWLNEKARLRGWVAWGKWDVQYLSSEVECTPAGDRVSMLRTKGSIQWGSNQISFHDMIFSADDVLMSATSNNSFSINPAHDQVMAVGGSRSGTSGTIDFTQTGKLIFKEVQGADIKIVGDGPAVQILSFELYPDSKMKLLTGVQTRVQPLPASFQDKTNEILSCAADFDIENRKSQKGKVRRSYNGRRDRAEQLNEIFFRTREALKAAPADSAMKDLDQILGDCKSKKIARRVTTDRIYGLSTAYVNRAAKCYRYGAQANAAGMAGGSLGFWIFECRFVSGQVRWYVGPQVGFSLGLGASVFTDFSRDKNNKKKVHLHGDMDNTGSYEVDIIAGRAGTSMVVTTVDAPTMEVVTPFGTLDTVDTIAKRRGIGAMIRASIEFTFGPHLYTEKRRDYSQAFQRLTEGLTENL